MEPEPARQPRVLVEIVYTVTVIPHSISDRAAFTLCVEPQAAKALHRSSAEPPSSHKPPDSVISNWQRVTF
jgi:hypothetical protein